MIITTNPYEHLWPFCQKLYSADGVKTCLKCSLNSLFGNIGMHTEIFCLDKLLVKRKQKMIGVI